MPLISVAFIMKLSLITYVFLCLPVHSLLHLNIRSLPSNYDKIIHYLSSLKHNLSVIALLETWLTKDPREIFRLTKYDLVHCVRENRSGGGVSLFILGNSEFKITDDLSPKLDMAEVECFCRALWCHW